MKTGTRLRLTILVLAAGFVSRAVAGPIVSVGTITSSTYNTSGGSGNYSNASSIVPATGDIAVGSTTLKTNYVGNNEAAGGAVGVLVDNQTASSPTNAGNASLNPNEATSATNATFDLGAGPQPWYGAFTLPVSGSGNGYDIARAQVISGHQDDRVNQIYDLLVSSDGLFFFRSATIPRISFPLRETWRPRELASASLPRAETGAELNRPSRPIPAAFWPRA